LKTASELACDEAVAAHMDKTEREKYSRLVIHMSGDTRCSKKTSIVSLGSDKKHMKKRIDCIMREKKKTSIAAVILSVAIVLCSSSTAFAYKPTNILDNDILAKPLNPGEEVSFIQDTSLPDDFVWEVVYDSQFTDSSGHVYNVETTTAQTACSHNYTIGDLQIHIKDNSSGCAVEIYSAKRCAKCGHVKKGALKNKLTYLKCPH